MGKQLNCVDRLFAFLLMTVFFFINDDPSSADEVKQKKLLFILIRILDAFRDEKVLLKVPSPQYDVLFRRQRSHKMYDFFTVYTEYTFINKA